MLKIWRVACFEWLGALRSKRALVVLMLYMLAAVCNMYFTISALNKVETELAEALRLPQSEKTGVVSATLWKSDMFQKMIRTATHDDAVFNDILGKHPVELIYAWFAFFYAPLLVVLVAGNRVADDIRSGTVRYMAFRVTRGQWSTGKFIGQALMIGGALACSAVAAYIVGLFRLGGGGTGLFLPMLTWSFKAWIYSLSFLGVALGVSHLTSSGSKATAMGIFAIGMCFALEVLLAHFTEPEGWRSFFPHIAQLLPSTHKLALWRNASKPLIHGMAFMLSLGALYMTLGFMWFRRKDI